MEEKQLNRIIGRYTGAEKGPLLICIGGIHGNEISGINAINLMLKMLEVEPITNSTFTYNGRFLGVRGNLKAIHQGVRYLKHDLNRKWIADDVARIVEKDISELDCEEAEMHDIYHTINREVETYQPSSLIFLDLHTTTATGGIFTIPHEDDESIRIAKELHAPVVLGLLDGIQGTIMHFFNQKSFPNIPTISICFESGQHKDPLSTNRAIAAITNCMSAIGSIRKSDVANRHDYLLQSYSEGLPAISHLIKKHTISSGDGFRMRPGYKNFQNVDKGEILATDKKGQIDSPCDCMILMPLYQKQGEDGFFLIKEGL